MSRLWHNPGKPAHLLATAASCVWAQAYMFGIAHEFDPYFGLSISRVDPLPHSLRRSMIICSSSPGCGSFWPMTRVLERPSWLACLSVN